MARSADKSTTLARSVSILGRIFLPFWENIIILVSGMARQSITLNDTGSWIHLMQKYGSAEVTLGGKGSMIVRYEEILEKSFDFDHSMSDRFVSLNDRIEPVIT
ncbi:hypothetical protein KIN20_027366, partial [Parelaphostrongylus tenuis]